MKFVNDKDTNTNINGNTYAFPESFIENIYYPYNNEQMKIIKEKENNYLEKFCKESSFLEPFYSPGIFYNLIKSGIAVDWSVYTGSLPLETFFTNMNKSPDFKISFESILDIFNGLPISSSNKNEENRIMKSRVVNYGLGAGDYLNEAEYFFQGFFELERKSNPLYSLAINNFFAETINLFLK